MGEPETLSVSELTFRLKALVETGFARVHVEGEISNFSRASSGHCYLTLKDENAQLRAVMWRSVAQRVKFELHDGLHVVAAGPIEVYAARGTYQLVIEKLTPQGIGPLELAFRQLYEKLTAEGLFAAERKRPIPAFPRRIAIVTSPTGAAIRDMLQVITRRWPACDLIVIPVAVQGQGAAAEIAEGIGAAAKIAGVDVIIAGRGGGSLEDLWAFNEEAVARAIFRSPLPVISAVGHEIDVTIADLVADRRALTPSEAGELVVPLFAEIESSLQEAGKRMTSALAHALRRSRMMVESLAQSRALARPIELVRTRERLLNDLADRLRRATTHRGQNARRQLEVIAGGLEALSPLKVLGRGYSVTRQVATGEVLRDAAGLRAGDQLQTILQRGRVLSVVSETHDGDGLAERA